MYYYVNRGGMQLGPYDEPTLRAMLAQGQLWPQDLVMPQGGGGWQPLSTVLGGATTYAQPGNPNAASPYGPYPPPGAAYGQMPYAAPGQPVQQAPPVFVPVGTGPIVMAPPKSRIAYILLGLFLGGLGIHNFYAGYAGRGVAQLLITLLTGWLIVPLFVVGLWVLIEIIVVSQDAYGRPMV